MKPLPIATLIALALAAASPRGGERQPSRPADPAHNNVRPAPARPAPHEASGPTWWSYRNCAEARRAGAAPIYRGQPGYGPHLDADHDGVACERYPAPAAP